MPVITETIPLSTRGHTDIIDVTPAAREILELSSLHSGTALFFVSGSTAGITTIEYEPGLLTDLPEAFERFAPASEHYEHNARWGDGNGVSHVRAAMLGPSLTVPFHDHSFLLGTWQQVVLVDFDTRPRQRQIVLQLSGE